MNNTKTNSNLPNELSTGALCHLIIRIREEQGRPGMPDLEPLSREVKRILSTPGCPPSEAGMPLLQRLEKDEGFDPEELSKMLRLIDESVSLQQDDPYHTPEEIEGLKDELARASREGDQNAKLLLKHWGEVCPEGFGEAWEGMTRSQLLGETSSEESPAGKMARALLSGQPWHLSSESIGFSISNDAGDEFDFGSSERCFTLADRLGRLMLETNASAMRGLLAMVAGRIDDQSLPLRSKHCPEIIRGRATEGGGYLIERIDLSTSEQGEVDAPTIDSSIRLEGPREMNNFAWAMLEMLRGSGSLPERPSRPEDAGERRPANALWSNA